MIIARIDGCTRVVGKQQGYLGLPVRDEKRVINIGGQNVGVDLMVTAWEPTPDELERLNKGARVHLSVLGSGHPPVLLEVSEPAE